MKTFNYRTIVITFLLFVGFTACVKNVALQPSNANCSAINAKYSVNIQPMIAAKCATPACHGGAISPNLTTYANVNSHILDGHIPDRVLVKKDMPSAGSPQLTIEELDALRCWIADGHPNN
jgi:hypothetical protein